MHQLLLDDSSNLQFTVLAVPLAVSPPCVS